MRQERRIPAAAFEHCVRFLEGVIREESRNDAAIHDRQRIIKCLKEEYNTFSGESIDSQKREIERLKRRKELQNNQNETTGQ